MGFLAKATTYRVGEYKGGTKQLAVSTAKSSANDYTAMHAFAPGLEICPAEGESLVIERLNGSSSFMAATGGVNQGIEPDTARGERRLYSVSEDGGSVAASVKLKNDGALEFNKGTEPAARQGDTTQLVMSVTDIQTLAGLILATGAFTPSGNPVAPPPSGQTFTGGEVTSGSPSTLLPND